MWLLLCHYLALPDPEGHRPKRNENNSCGITQQYNKLLSSGPNGPQTAAVRICLGVNGSLIKATCNWLTGRGGGGIYFFRKWGINYPNERFSSCNALFRCFHIRAEISEFTDKINNFDYYRQTLKKFVFLKTKKRQIASLVQYNIFIRRI